MNRIGTKQTMIQTAYEMFGRNGFHGIGLDQIIDAVGVSKQTFYNHFEGKDDLILAVLTHRHEVESEMFAGLFKKLGGTDPTDQLYAIFDVLGAWFNAPDWRGCIFLTAAAEFPSPHDPAHRAAAAHSQSFLDQLQYLSTLAGADDPRDLAEQLAVLVEGAVAYRHITHDPRAASIACKTAKLLLDTHLPKERQRARGIRRAVAKV